MMLSSLPPPPPRPPMLLICAVCRRVFPKGRHLPAWAGPAEGRDQSPTSALPHCFRNLQFGVYEVPKETKIRSELAPYSSAFSAVNWRRWRGA